MNLDARSARVTKLFLSAAAVAAWPGLLFAQFSRDPWLSPGKADFLFRHNGAQNDVSFIWWTPSAEGGSGLYRYWGCRDCSPAAFSPACRSEGARRPDYRPAKPVDAGRFRLGIAGRIPLPVGLGTGSWRGRTAPIPGWMCGSASLLIARPRMGRAISWRHRRKASAIISPGAYGALYNKHWMLVAGAGWRTVADVSRIYGQQQKSDL